MASLAASRPQVGYRPLYRAGVDCPACGASAWHVGRRSAECARCATALPLAPERPQREARA